MMKFIEINVLIALRLYQMAVCFLAAEWWFHEGNHVLLTIPALGPMAVRNHHSAHSLKLVNDESAPT